MRISRDDMLREIAQVVAKRSTCSRARVGVVIARDGRPLVTGYNGAPAGMPHCSHHCTCFLDEPARHELIITYDAHLENCNSQKPCDVSVHAEANAISFAARWGINLEGSELFTTLVPCLACAQLIINSGVTKIFFDAEYRDGRGLSLLQNAGIDCVALD